jgi:hypothetical protein
MVSWFDIAKGMGYGRATEPFRKKNRCPYCEFKIKEKAKRCPNCRLPLRRCSICNNVNPELDAETNICPRCFDLITEA